MDLFGILHIPMPIMGTVFFVLGTALVGLVKDIENGPAPSRWLRHDMSVLLVGTALTLPISLGLGLMIAGVISFVMGYSASVIEILAMIAILIVGRQLTTRPAIGFRRAST